MNLDLKKKIALITGSGQGLGKGIAEGFIKEGAKVTIADISATRLEASKRELKSKYLNAEIHTYCGDLTKKDQINECVSKSIDQFGRIDFLIANLGSGKSIPDWNSSDEEWTRIVNINFESARKMTNTVVPYMIENGTGSIIFISSIAGKEIIGAPVSYSVAKASLIAYSKNLSIKLGSMGIRVNTICPGNIYFKNGVWDLKMKNDEKDVKSMLESKIPLKRFTTPEEVANLVLFLSSDVSAFITGSCITIDGGQTVSI